MPEFIATAVEPPDTGPADPRIGNLLGTNPDAGGTRAAIVGFPCDEGVRRNGGRVGAAQGPEAIRQWLYRLTPDARHGAMDDLLSRSLDLGDLKLSGDLEADQEQLAGVIGQVLKAGEVPVVLGGGHETAYGHFLGYVNAGRAVGISNLDAHADVRELKQGQGHSGSPFRQALEHASGLCEAYRVAGLQAQSVSREHIEYLQARDCPYWFADDTNPDLLDALYASNGATYASFCLDAVDAAFAPGVSAPATNGLHPSFWLQAAEYAGRCSRVTSFDVVELNPNFDVDERTARLAAMTVWRFLRGLAAREHY